MRKKKTTFLKKNANFQTSQNWRNMNYTLIKHYVNMQATRKI